MTVENIDDHKAWSCQCGSVRFNLLKSRSIECGVCGDRFGAWFLQDAGIDKSDLREILKSTQFTVKMMSRLLGLQSERTFRRWQSGKDMIPHPIQFMFSLLLKNHMREKVANPARSPEDTPNE